MDKSGKKRINIGFVILILFIIWTALIQVVDVKPLGQNGTDIGLSTLNCWFHEYSGVHMWLCTVTDWLEIVLALIFVLFIGMILTQWVKRKKCSRIDSDLIILGIFYVVAIAIYLSFKVMPINYRPILINGVMEPSYPSMTTLLAMCVMLTFIEQINRRVANITVKRVIQIVSVALMCFMVIGRLLAGVHWLSDIVGSVLLSSGLFMVYAGCVRTCKGYRE